MVVGRVALCTAALLAAVLPARAKTARLSFPKGSTGTTVKGTIAGEVDAAFLLGAAKGQRLQVVLTSDNDGAYFNVFEPGKGPGDAALFIGSTGGSTFEGTLPATGDYTVQVYLVRSAARRRETARYTLAVQVTGSAGTHAGPGSPPPGDARVPGTRYHATGKLPCSMGSASPGSAQCDFGVIRGAPGHAEVHVTPPGGFERVLRFAGSTVTADGDARVIARRSGDRWSVDVDDYEHYQIPDAVIAGG